MFIYRFIVVNFWDLGQADGWQKPYRSGMGFKENGLDLWDLFE